ncbi:MAG: hypothetical protein ACI361_02340 [Atopobiaceae bacterium]
MKVETAAAAVNGILNPLLLCAFLPVLEGAPHLDMSTFQGFWGLLVVADVVAEIPSALPAFGQLIGFCLSHFGFRHGSAAEKIAGVVVGATLCFLVIGAAECILTGGLGEHNGKTYFVRWASLITTGWGFVVVGGLFLDPIAHAIARALCGSEAEGSSAGESVALQ